MFLDYCKIYGHVSIYQNMRKNVSDKYIKRL